MVFSVVLMFCYKSKSDTTGCNIIFQNKGHAACTFNKRPEVNNSKYSYFNLYNRKIALPGVYFLMFYSSKKNHQHNL